jgi:hypothetical protein
MQAFLRPLAILLAGAIAAPALLAQDTQPAPVRLSFEQPAGVRAHTGIATINPFAVILGGVNGDVELNIGVGTTGALSVSWFPDDLNYTAVDFTFRYYPGELNPKGFSVGASIGYLSSEHDDGTAEGKGPAIGFIGGYNWLLGRSERLAIATGLGLKRLIADSDKYPDAPEVIPSGRLGIGMSF